MLDLNQRPKDYENYVPPASARVSPRIVRSSFFPLALPTTDRAYSESLRDRLGVRRTFSTRFNEFRHLSRAETEVRPASPAGKMPYPSSGAQVPCPTLPRAPFGTTWATADKASHRPGLVVKCHHYAASRIAPLMIMDALLAASIKDCELRTA